MPKQTLQQFGQSIKAKHPEYKDMDDAALAQAVLAKYPQYSDMVVSSDSIQNVPGATPGMAEPGARGPAPKLSKVAAPGEFGKGFIGTIPHMIAHPVETVAGMGQPFTASGMAPGGMYPTTASLPSQARPGAPLQLEAQQGQHEAAEAIKENPAYAGGGLASQLLLGEGVRRLAPVVSGAGTAIRTAAIGDPDVAAVKAAGVPKDSALGFRNDVQGARPYLTGAKSVEDVQKAAGIGGTARDEIYKPINDFLSEHGSRVVHGPDGPTTLGNLEAERAQVSAQLRQLKAGGPEGIALATQKGLNQADLLARQQAIEGAMDPHFQAAGIDSPLIRQTYGQVARVGDEFSGRWTPAEKPTPYGFGRLTNVDVLNPRTWLGQPAQGVRDLVAGRPIWSGNAGDVGVSEAFRTGGPKPDFRASVAAMPRFENAPRLLEANVPGNAPFGDEPYAGSTNGMPERNPVHVTPAPNVRGLLPDSASEPNYMRRYIEPEPQGIRTPPPVPPRGLLPSETAPSETQPYIAYRPAPPAGERFGVVPSRYARLQMQGEPLPSSGGIKGLLPAPEVPAPSPAPTAAHIYPAGSAFRDLSPETPFYPPGSQFRPKIAPFDVDEYLRNQTKPLVPPQGTQ